MAKPTVISSDIVDQATVQLNVRIPVRLRQKLDGYLQHMDRPFDERLKASKNWPASKQAVVIKALEEFLESHPQKLRPGPEKDPPKPPIEARPKGYQTRIP